MMNRNNMMNSDNKNKNDTGLSETAMRKGFKELLAEGFHEITGVNIGDMQLDSFEEYKDLLVEWNKIMNLTAIEDEREISVKHFLDSLSVIPWIKHGSRIIDVGTGAGFPGIPLKIVLDDIDLVLIDSLEKRTRFLNTVIERLNLKSISAIHARAEDLGKDPEYRESFDIAVARAVAPLPVLLEYCLPFVKTGGIFIAMKGSKTDEIEASSRALDILGGRVEEIKKLTLPFSNFERNVVIIKKFRQTPIKYPRKSGKPSKEPL